MSSGYEKLTGYLRNLFGVDVSVNGVNGVAHSNRLQFGNGLNVTHNESTGRTDVSAADGAESVQRGVNLSSVVTNWSNAAGSLVDKSSIEATISGDNGALRLLGDGFATNTKLTAYVTMWHGQRIQITGVSGAYLVLETAVYDGLAVYTFRFNGTEWVRIDSWNKCTDVTATNGTSYDVTGNIEKEWSPLPGLYDYSGNEVELRLFGGNLTLTLKEYGAIQGSSVLTINFEVLQTGIASTVTISDGYTTIASYQFSGTAALRRSAQFYFGSRWRPTVDQSILVNGAPVPGITTDGSLGCELVDGAAQLTMRAALDATKAAQMPVSGAVVCMPLLASYTNYGTAKKLLVKRRGDPVLATEGLSLDGVDDVASVDTGTSGLTAFTVGFRGKFPSAQTTDTYSIRFLAERSPADSAGTGVGVDRTATQFRLYTGWTAWIDALAGDGNEHTFVIRQASNTSRQLFVDGTLRATDTHAPSAAFGPMIYFGAANASGAASASGVFRNVGVFATALSDDDLALFTAWISSGATDTSGVQRVRQNVAGTPALTLYSESAAFDNVDVSFFPRKNTLVNPIACVRGLLASGVSGSEAGWLRGYGAQAGALVPGWEVQTTNTVPGKAYFVSYVPKVEPSYTWLPNGAITTWFDELSRRVGFVIRDSIGNAYTASLGMVAKLASPVTLADNNATTIATATIPTLGNSKTYSLLMSARLRINATGTLTDVGYIDVTIMASIVTSAVGVPTVTLAAGNVTTVARLKTGISTATATATAPGTGPTITFTATRPTGIACKVSKCDVQIDSLDEVI